MLTLTPPILSESEGAVSASSKKRRATTPEATMTVSKPRSRFQWRRMAFHMIFINLAAVLAMVISDELWRYRIIMIVLSLTALYELLRKYIGPLGRLFDFLQGREEELTTRTASTDFVIAMSVIACVCSPRVAATAFATAAFADPFARMFGIAFGTVKWPRSRKTYEGSAACFMVALATVKIGMEPLPWVLALIAATVATGAELIPQRIYKTWFGPIPTPGDNFYIPLATAAVLSMAS